MKLKRPAFMKKNPVSPIMRSRTRLAVVRLGFLALFTLIGGRMVQFAFYESEEKGTLNANEESFFVRPDILDRNGQILAADLRRASLYIEPHHVIDKEEIADKLAKIFPDLSASELEAKLDKSKKGFFWVKRQITPQQQRQVHQLGLPGLGFRYESKRSYPNSVLASHILGHVDKDNKGTAGIERFLDQKNLSMPQNKKEGELAPVALSIDLSAQHIFREELYKAQETYKAKASAGVIMDVKTGEVISMVSLPDYDPNQPAGSMDETRMNRLTTGVFEMGSTFKALTTAMALDSGKTRLDDKFDARFPLVYGGKPIHDFHPERRFLSVPEIFIHSSNIGTARMALKEGVTAHKAFLKKMGLLERMHTELPESASPLYPKFWQEVNTVTASFGHGIAVAPLQAVAAISALMNGGLYVPPTFLKRNEEEALKVSRRVVSETTSNQMRFLMRLNAEKGSGKKADVEGYYVGGKTGTSEKVIGGRYVKNKLLTAFMGVFPTDKPKYLILVMLDEPQGLKETYGFATSGWNAAPATAKIIARLGPVLGLEPRYALPQAQTAIPVAFRGQVR
jgi:cell division protein FtsI (penicillin-binding protein 3)